ncbi:craniofacial development protein 1 [Eublepharis macularius]|uniref:Craniofacial development protein 1 n=1 Tax=Eublepharis macularius TaxID=481883 RepID=A0AA97LIP1_EUBMA|nr:craniofacial development protein 1 [Eublepharis macularius]
MSDSEEYSSEEDEDYLPSGEDYSEDDVNELVEEEDQEEKPSCREKCKKASKEIRGRERNKGGSLPLEPGGETSKDDTSDSKDDDDLEDLEESCSVVKEEEKKKKEEALWASFLSDVGQKPGAAATDHATCVQKDKPVGKKTCKPQEMSKEPQKPKVAITEVFDFAGEEVRITKEVDVSSKEAQIFLKKQEQKAASPVSHPTGSGVKRPGGLNSLLGKLGTKKQKMSTLEKSKLDWEHFKEEEGIGEELAIHNRGKEGYLDRKAFLERVDHRQFEIERDIRLSNMKP